jgi:hypothetical protein
MRTTVLGLVALSLLFPSAAQAQYRPNTPPPVSPYLNLLRNGGNLNNLTTLNNNYYNLVRPEFEFRAGINQLQQQSYGAQQAISGLEASTVPTTGHPFGFQTHNSYFNNLGSGGVGVPGASLTAPGASGASARPAPQGGGKK